MLEIWFWDGVFDVLWVWFVVVVRCCVVDVVWCEWFWILKEVVVVYDLFGIGFWEVVLVGCWGVDLVFVDFDMDDVVEDDLLWFVFMCCYLVFVVDV